MTMAEQIYAQAVVLCGGVEESKQAMLQLLCRAAMQSLCARLRPGLSPDDCKADFIASASLYALAAMSELDEAEQPERMQIGDVTMQRRSATPAAACLRNQAALMIGPYVCDGFSFLGV